MAQLEAERRTEADVARGKEVELLAKKGEIEEALRRTREDTQKALDAERASRAALEDRAKRYALDGELSRVLASQPLVPNGAEQLTQLWRKEFVVEPSGDSFRVQTPTFQSVGDFVKSRLSDPGFAHFLRRTTPAAAPRADPLRRRCAADGAGATGGAARVQEFRRGDHPAGQRESGGAGGRRFRYRRSVASVRAAAEGLDPSAAQNVESRRDAQRSQITG